VGRSAVYIEQEGQDAARRGPRYNARMSGSDLEITANYHVVFNCKNGRVEVDYWNNGEKTEGPRLLPSEAATKGKRIEETGDPGEFLISAHVKQFGMRLREHGENCS
jgi:hypothetical protein